MESLSEGIDESALDGLATRIAHLCVEVLVAHLAVRLSLLRDKALERALALGAHKALGVPGGVRSVDAGPFHGHSTLLARGQVGLLHAIFAEKLLVLKENLLVQVLAALGAPEAGLVPLQARGLLRSLQSSDPVLELLLARSAPRGVLVRVASDTVDLILVLAIRSDLPVATLAREAVVVVELPSWPDDVLAVYVALASEALGKCFYSVLLAIQSAIDLVSTALHVCLTDDAREAILVVIFVVELHVSAGDLFVANKALNVRFRWIHFVPHFALCFPALHLRSFFAHSHVMNLLH